MYEKKTASHYFFKHKCVFVIDWENNIIQIPYLCPYEKH